MTDHRPVIDRRSLTILIITAFVAGLIGSVTPTLYATQDGDPGQATARGFNTQNTAAETDDMVINLGVYDGTNWQRLHGSAGGALTGDISTTGGNTQQALSTASAAVPTTALTNRFEICVFNQDTAINVWCKKGTTAAIAGSGGTGNGSLVEPRTGRCFRTTQALQCIATSGAPVIDYEERGP